MKLFILGIAVLSISSPVFATTAVTCGDQDDASVHLIFDNEDSRAIDEISVSFFGKSSKVLSVKERSGNVYIHTAKPKRIVLLNKSVIDYSNCDGESVFPVVVIEKGMPSSVDNCRCFAD